MTQNRKSLGMTPAQLGILAALAAVACLLFGLAAWFALRAKLNPFAHVPEDTPVPQSTSTPFVIPTLTPTETPTLIPYEMRISDGWVQFKSELVEIWLPRGFKSVDPQKFMAQAKTNAKKLNLTASSGEIFGQSTNLDLLLVDDSERSTFTNLVVYVLYEPLETDSLDALVDAKVSQLPMEYRLVERRKVRVGSYEAIRLLGEITIQSIQANDLVYLIQDGDTIWYVMYDTKLEEFYNHLADFEKSIQTFRTVQ